MEVHCDQYAFNLEKEKISASSFCDDDSYIFSAYMNIYKGMTYCIKTQKGKKMAAVCLWLIENKSIQMLNLFCAICAGMVRGAALSWALKVLRDDLNKRIQQI